MDNNNDRSRVVTLSATRAHVRLARPTPPNPDADCPVLSPAEFHRFLSATERPPAHSHARRRHRRGAALAVLALALTVLATLAYFVATRPADPSPASLPGGAHLPLDVCQGLLTRTRYPDPLKTLCQAPP